MHPGHLRAPLPDLGGCKSRRLPFSYRLICDSVIHFGAWPRDALSPRECIRYLQGGLMLSVWLRPCSLCFLRSSSRGWEHALWSKGLAAWHTCTRGMSAMAVGRRKHMVSCRFTPHKTPLSLRRYLQIISCQVNPEMFIVPLQQC